MRLQRPAHALYPSASEVTTLWRYTNLFIIISSSSSMNAYKQMSVQMA